MKDLYTFDASHEVALETYSQVRQAYTNLFDELKIPYLVADADSGNMGGKLSHEYHFVSPKGEDNVWSCSSCSYVANEELVEKKAPKAPGKDTPWAHGEPLIFTGITLDRKSTIKIVVPRPHHLTISEPPSWNRISEYVNMHAAKRFAPELDTGIEAGTLAKFLTAHQPNSQDRNIIDQFFENHTEMLDSSRENDARSEVHHGDLTPTRQGDACPRCPHGSLSVQKAIEVGHTFHLGTRYSEPLSALVAVPSSNEKQPIHMGCHGIGVSRLVGSIASLLSDDKGLNWPRAVAPFEAVVVTTPQVREEDSISIYDSLQSSSIDIVLDDRAKPLGWKLRDADLIGYPIIIVLGKAWKEERCLEVQCRRLGVKKVIQEGEVRKEVEGLLAQL